MRISFLKEKGYAIKITLALVCSFATGGFLAQSSFALSCDSNSSTRFACDSASCGVPNYGAMWLNGSGAGAGDEYNGLWADGGQTYATGWLHGAVYTVSSDHECESYGNVGAENRAHHVHILNNYIGEGEWANLADSAYSDWNRAHYITSGQDGEFSRGTVPSAGNWTSNWDGDATQVGIDLRAFLWGATEEPGDWFVQWPWLFRCYHPGRGCDATPTEIRIHIPTWETEDTEGGYRVYYQGKVSLKNDDNSPLYEHGSMLRSNSWPEWAGWEDGNKDVNVNLYTPKDTGQKIRSKFEIKNSCNNWDECGWKKHNLTYWGDYYYGLYGGWHTRYGFLSQIGNEMGGGNFYTAAIWSEQKEIAQKSRAFDLPYGYTQEFTEMLAYKSDGNNHKEATEHVRWRLGEVVANWATYRNYNEGDDMDTNRTIHTTIRNPYNFTTSVSSAINGGNGSTVLGGSTATLQLSANIKSRTQQETTASAEVGFPYYTKVPADTKVTAAKFILKQDVDANSVNDLLKDRFEVNKYQVADDNICNYLNTTFGSNIVKAGDTESDNSCQTLFTEDSNSINNNIGETGWNTSTNNAVANNGVSAITDEHKSFSVSIPDIEDGYKYCTVIGIKHSNSGGRDGGYLFPYSINDNWHLSNISCRTIAKVPSFQTWGNIYTSGGISTTTVKKIPDADIKTPAESQKYLFGSWSETFSLANKDIKNFGTGASLGYLNNNLGGLPIADSNNKMNYCNIVNMTIANTRCNSGIGGNAGNIVVSNEDFLNKFVAHYATTTTEQLDRVTDTVSYYKAKGNATFNDTSALADNGYRLGNGVISLNNNTLIYQVDGNLTINHNVCTGYPTEEDQCNNGTNDHYIYNFYNLDNANVPYNASSDKIPQIIIIASGDINIDKSVTEIDAWLYSGGTIKTCYNGNLGDDSCGEPLIVHGPVFAKNLELHRTYGSAGARRWEGNFDSDSRFFYSGATTPAEIFELRSDVYQWIYQQTSTDNKNANVRYMRELSPRY